MESVSPRKDASSGSRNWEVCGAGSHRNPRVGAAEVTWHAHWRRQGQFLFLDPFSLKTAFPCKLTLSSKREPKVKLTKEESHMECPRSKVRKIQSFPPVSPCHASLWHFLKSWPGTVLGCHRLPNYQPQSSYKNATPSLEGRLLCVPSFNAGKKATFSANKRLKSSTFHFII